MKTLKIINTLISNAEPNKYSSISYGKYYRDLASISSSIIDDNKKYSRILSLLHSLPDSPTKIQLIDMVNDCNEVELK